MKKYCLMAVSGILLIASIFFSSCSKENNDTAASPSSTIYIRNGQFTIPNLEVTAGTPITWINEDGVKHSVTAEDGTFDSGDILPGQAFGLTLNNVGIYDYYSKYKPDMKAKLTIRGFR